VDRSIGKSETTPFRIHDQVITAQDAASPAQAHEAGTAKDCVNNRAPLFVDRDTLEHPQLLSRRRKNRKPAQVVHPHELERFIGKCGIVTAQRCLPLRAAAKPRERII
jgi:hypothetical protein